MKRVYLEESWPSSWKYCYPYDLEEVYGQINNRGYVYAYRNRRSEALRLLTAVLSPGARVLDIAAAQGNFTLALAEMGFEVTWNDLREDLAGYVRLKYERGGVHFAPGNVFEGDFPEPFDALLATEIIEHVAHPDEFLSKLSGLVRPGGYIILTTPNGAYFRNKLPRFSDCPDPEKYEAVQFKPNADGHIFLLHPDEMQDLADCAGLESEELVLFNNPVTCGYIGTAPLLRALPSAAIDWSESALKQFPHSWRSRLAVQMAVRLRKPAQAQPMH